MLDQLRINIRLMLIVAAAIIGMLAVASVGLLNLRSNLFDERQDKLKSLAQVAESILEYYYHRAEAGEMSEEEARKRAVATIQEIRYGNNDYIFIYEPDGTLLAHPNISIINTNRLKTRDQYGNYYIKEMINNVLAGQDFTYFYYPRAGQETYLRKMIYAKLINAWNIIICTGEYIDDIDQRFWSNIAVIAAIITVLLMGVAAIALLIAGSIRKPLKRITNRMVELARGNTTIDIPGIGRADEIGDMARAVVVFKESMIEAERLAGQERRHQEAHQRRTEQIEDCIRAFDQAIAAVIQTVSASATQLHSDAQGLSATADQTSQQASAVACAAEQASANVQTVAAATEELSASVSEIRRQVQESSHIATTAVDATHRTNGTVAGLSEAARKIGDVVKLINGIASQTNLLALNATIEATRAGAAGKGFTVVASEVKILAKQTAKATEDIQAQVSQMQAVTDTAVEAIRGIGDTIRHMSEITTTIASAVSQQGAATQEIARNVTQATTGTSQVSTNIADVSKAAGDTGTMASQALSAALELTQQAEFLRGVVDRFIQQVRAA